MGLTKIFFTFRGVKLRARISQRFREKNMKAFLDVHHGAYEVIVKKSRAKVPLILVE
jgi:hypothetical protein